MIETPIEAQKRQVMLAVAVYANLYANQRSGRVTSGSRSLHAALHEVQEALERLCAVVVQQEAKQLIDGGGVHSICVQRVLAVVRQEIADQLGSST
jgi:hypothetical protein